MNDATFARAFLLFTSQVVNTGWGVDAGKGAIVGRVVDNSNPQSVFIGGATVTFTSAKYPASPPYTVKYRDASGGLTGTSTYTDGRYYILNVEEGDTVTVTATKTGWSFTQRIFVTHADAVSQALIGGDGQDAAAIKSGLQSLIDGFNDKSISAFISFFSTNYLNDGMTYSSIQEYIQQVFSNQSLPILSATISSLSVSGSTATMVVTWNNAPGRVAYRY